MHCLPLVLETLNDSMGCKSIYQEVFSLRLRVFVCKRFSQNSE